MSKETVLKTRKYKAGYVLKTVRVDGADFGCPNFEIVKAETPEGYYIGDSNLARMLCKKWGIKPELATPSSNICSVGFCAENQKWYGWSHRAICGFGIGDVAKEGDCCTQSRWVDEYLAEHPEADRSVPVGFEAKTLDDARRMAVAFADAVA